MSAEIGGVGILPRELSGLRVGAGSEPATNQVSGNLCFNVLSLFMERRVCSGSRGA